MKRIYITVAMLLALVLFVTACGAQATPASVQPSPIAPTAMPLTQAPATSAPALGATVSLGKTDALGSFLVDDKGMTLYLFTKDMPNTSACYDKCATSWPPLLTTGNPVAGAGVDASKLGTTKRTDGSMQVTYNGWPLYYFAKDKASGDITGQNIGSVWFVVSPTGDAIKTAP